MKKKAPHTPVAHMPHAVHPHTHLIADVLTPYLDWLSDLISARMQHYFGDGQAEDQVEFLLAAMPMPDLGTPLERTAAELALDAPEMVTLLLALAPQLRPQMLDIFFVKNTAYDRPFTEFGGVKDEHQTGFVPTAETALFVLCGMDLRLRLRYRPIFLTAHPLFRMRVLVAPDPVSQPTRTGFALRVHDDYLGYLLTGHRPMPAYSPSFPARRLETALGWDDLMVEPEVAAELQEIRAWVEHAPQLMQDWGLARMVAPGFKCLFYGPPGTGKSLSAALIGQLTDHEVYRIDLSMVVSKYIGETEKNLASVFDQAMERRWILFFDEADALFGKRTNTSSSNDRYANQEVAYLLQRIEEFPGLVVLATNLKSNIDEAFQRRFQSVVYFGAPDALLRQRLWIKALSTGIPLAPHLPIDRIAKRYELTGGEIVNVVRHAALLAVARADQTLHLADIISGIQRAFRHAGRMFEPLDPEE